MINLYLYVERVRLERTSKDFQSLALTISATAPCAVFPAVIYLCFIDIFYRDQIERTLDEGSARIELACSVLQTGD